MKKLSPNAQYLLSSRYLLSDNMGVQETPKAMFERVARCVASVELKYGGTEKFNFYNAKFLKLLTQLDFLPNSPTLMNAGTEIGQLSACFVLSIEDSIDSIFSTLQHVAVIQKTGGGTGFNFSKLRPRGDTVSKRNDTAAGPVAFMKVFNAATENIKQAGRRRGANMAILNISHPDIIEFVTAKENETTLNNFNLSVGVTDDFMQAVAQNKPWELINPRTQKVTDTIMATSLWELIVKNAWNSGDPGVIFLDTIEKCNSTPKIGTLNATNPCGEMPLLDYESCNLGSINLSNMMASDSAVVDWVKLEKTVNLSIRFLDNVIDANQFPLVQTKAITLANRKIGLGVMGWADMLIKLGIPYASEKAVELAEKVMQFINTQAFVTSQELAVEKGAFPNWENSIYFPDQLVRNATRTSIAPTGSISIIAGVSSSIEPLFALIYQREHVLDGHKMPEVSPLFLEHISKKDLNTEKVLGEVKSSGSVKTFKDWPREDRSLFQTALEINSEYHLRHQVAFQKYTDNAVSKTINLPYKTTPDQISKLYFNAWKSGLKGITVYRYGSKKAQVLNIASEGLCGICSNT